jgi:AcrR family transcriptional regulator
MAKAGTRVQRVAERRQQILDVARAMAEADGWTAVTSRRLADAIGYTQPVLYGHFPGGKTEIMRTVALAGFAELAAATQAAMGDKTGRQAVAAVADVYLGFAATHPSLYEAMFQLPIDARFAQDDAEAELRSGFNALGAALGNDDDGTALERTTRHEPARTRRPDAPRAPAQPDSRTRRPLRQLTQGLACVRVHRAPVTPGNCRNQAR